MPPTASNPTIGQRGRSMDGGCRLAGALVGPSAATRERGHRRGPEQESLVLPREGVREMDHGCLMWGLMAGVPSPPWGSPIWGSTPHWSSICRTVTRSSALSTAQLHQNAHQLPTFPTKSPLTVSESSRPRAFHPSSKFQAVSALGSSVQGHLRHALQFARWCSVLRNNMAAPRCTRRRCRVSGKQRPSELWQ